MKSCFLIAALAVFLAEMPISIVSADDDRVVDEAQRDLAKLQGKWETMLGAGGQTIRNVQTIKDTTSTVERFNENDVLVHSHTAEFKLSVTDQIRVFKFFDLVVTAGPQRGQRFKGPRSFIYFLKTDVWYEARGLLVDQPEGNPRLMVWKRVVKDKVTITVEQPRVGNVAARE